jgi:hypothetical protein
VMWPAKRDSRATCYMDAATDRWEVSTEIREADRSRPSGPPWCERFYRRWYRR